MLLVFGGSRGARHINEAMAAAKDTLLTRDSVHVIHVAGRAEADTVRDSIGADEDGSTSRYVVHDYIDAMGSALAASDVVVSRAGATSIAEMTALGIPAVLVPYPYATDDHQTKNAAAVVDSGGGVVVSDDELDSPRFIEMVTDILDDSDKRATMAAASRRLGHPDAGQRVAKMVRAAASGHDEIDNEEAVR